MEPRICCSVRLEYEVTLAIRERNSACALRSCFCAAALAALSFFTVPANFLLVSPTDL